MRVLSSAWRKVAAYHARLRSSDMEVPPAAGPINNANRRRIELTVACKDCEQLPKVSGAGKIYHKDGIRYQLMHNGVKVIEDGYYGAWMTELIKQLRGHHEPQEEFVFSKILKNLPKGATMVE